MEIISSNDFVEVPEIFYSSDTDRPFQSCRACNRNLMKNGTLYFIEKAFKQYPKFNTKDVIFEYAMCIDCYTKTYNEFSVESRINLDRYFSQKVDFEQRRQKLLKKEGIHVDDWLSRCIVTGSDVATLEEYQIVGQFDGPNLMFHNHPFAIGFEAVDEMMKLLSNRTLDELDGFYGKYCGPPPEFSDLLKPRPLLV